MGGPFDKDDVPSAPENSTRQRLTALQDECLSLIRAKQYKSCEIVAQMELSRCRMDKSSAIPLEILGDCALATRQYQQAISFFRRAALVRGDQSKLRWKEAQCLSALGNVVEAAAILESVADRTLGMSMTLAHLCVASGRHVDAIEAFLEALRSNAYALEAVEWLAVLGADRNTVMEAVERGLSQKQDHEYLPVIELVSAHFLMHRNQTLSALHAFERLDKAYPNNAYLLRKVATLQVRTRRLPLSLRCSYILKCRKAPNVR